MNVEKLKQKILDLAIRGKLVPQDPNDEPASVLIEKIRAENEALIKQGKIKRDKNESYIFKGDDNSYYEKVNGETKKLTIPFSLPDNWTWVRLGSIFKIGSSKRIHKSDWRSNGIPFYRARDIEDINEGSFNSQIYIDPTLYESIKQQYGIPKIGDLLVTAVGTLGKVYIVNNNTPFYYKDGNIICFSNLHNINPFFIKMLFDTDFLKKQIKGDSKGTTVDTYTIIHANNTLIPIPSIREQSHIVSRYDEILTIASKIAVSKSEINALCKQLKISILDFYFGIDSRYKSYYENELKLGDILKYEQPAKYIVNSTNYSDDFSTPVLTPGKTFILGYTNEKEGIYHVNGEKVIIFDDFTTASRLVDFNFKVKSSAMKILTISNQELFDIEYMYLLLQTIPVNNNTHKRYWISNFATRKVKIHTIQEQTLIVKEIKRLYSIIEKVVG